MAYLDDLGIANAAVSFGKTSSFAGTPADVTVNVIPRGANGAGITLVWDATGDAFDSFTDTVSAAEGVVGVIALPQTGQDGFLYNAEAYKDWYYEAVVASSKGGEVITRTYRFQIPAGVTSLDLDRLPLYGPVITSPVSAPVPVVTSVDGMTGAVDTKAGIVEDINDLESDIGAVLSATFVPKRVHFIGIWGQSSARGQGLPYSADQNPSHPRIFQVPSVGGTANTIVPATDPLIMHDYPASVVGIGPGFQFARQWMQRLGEDDVIVLVGSAHGGTILSGDTTLSWRWGVSGGLSAQAVAQMQAGLTAAATMWPGAKVTVDGILWVQGEQDGTTGGGAGTPPATYQADLDALIAGVRTTFGNTRLPFIIGSMAPEYFSTGAVAAINTVHADTPYRVPFTGFALGSYGYVNSDNLHISDAGQRLIAAPRLYSEFQRVRNGIAPVYPRNGLPTAPSSGYEPFNGVGIVDTFTRTAAELSGSVCDTAQPWEGATGRFAVNGTRLIRHATLGATANQIKSTAIGDMSFTLAALRIATNLGVATLTRLNWNYQNSLNTLRIQISVSAGNVATCQLVVLVNNVAVQTVSWPALTIPTNAAAADYAVSATVDGLNVTATLNGATILATLTQAQKDALIGAQYFGLSTSHPVGFEADTLTVSVKGVRPIAA